MKLTVASRIIGGFGIISLLIITTTLGAILNLWYIKQDTVKARDVALPMLQLSNKLQTQLIEIERFSVLSYYSFTPPQLQAERAQQTTAQTQFSALLLELKQLHLRDNQLPSYIEPLNKAIDSVVKSTQLLHQVMSTKLKLTTNLSERMAELNDSFYETSGYLLDIIDIESEENQPLEFVIGMANNLDVMLATTLQIAKDLHLANNADSIELLTQQLAGSYSDLRLKYDFMADRIGGVLEQELINNLQAAFEHSAIFIAPTTTISIDKQQLSQNIAQAKKRYHAVDIHVAQTKQHLTQLLTLASSTAMQAQQQVINNVDRSTQQAIAIVIIAILFAIAIAWATIRRILTPLNQINGVLKTLANGDLSRQVKVDSNDEFMQLADNINQLSSKLRSLINGITHRASLLTAEAEQTSHTTDQTAIAMVLQQTEVDKVAAATNQLTSSANQVSSHANNTLIEIKHASEQAVSLASVLEQSRHTISSLDSDISSASTVIHKLHDDSTNIGSIVGVIRGIAEQTNLLALNAAIEAARAGEQGRGFAVVADEVRSLANRTQRSTNEIQSMIELIQSGAQQAVAVMEASQQRTKLCVTETQNTTRDLELMSISLQQADEMSLKITLATEQQNIVSKQISQRLDQIVQIAKTTSLGAQQTSDSNRQLILLAEELQSSAEKFST